MTAYLFIVFAGIFLAGFCLGFGYCRALIRERVEDIAGLPLAQQIFEDPL